MNKRKWASKKPGEIVAWMVVFEGKDGWLVSGDHEMIHAKTRRNALKHLKGRIEGGLGIPFVYGEPYHVVRFVAEEPQA